MRVAGIRAQILKLVLVLVLALPACKKPSGLTSSDRIHLFCTQVASDMEAMAATYRKQALLVGTAPIKTEPRSGLPYDEVVLHRNDVPLQVSSRLLAELYFCTEVRVTSWARDDALDSFPKLAQTYGESFDFAITAKSLEEMAALLRDVDQLPIQE